MTGRGCNFPWLKAGVDMPKTMHEIAQMVRIEDPFYGDSTPLLQRIRGELLGSFSTSKNPFLQPSLLFGHGKGAAKDSMGRLITS